MTLLSYITGIFSFLYQLALRLVQGNTLNAEERVVRAIEPNGTAWSTQPAIAMLSQTAPADWVVRSLDEPNPPQPPTGASERDQLNYSKALSISRRVRQEDFLTHLSAEQHPGVEALWCVHGLGATPYALLYQVEMVGRVLRVMPKVVIERLLYLIKHRELPKQYILGYCGMAPLMWVMQDLGISNAIHTRNLNERGIDDASLEYRARVFDNILNANGNHTVQFTCQRSTTPSQPISGYIMGGMSQTAVAYLSLTRGKVKYISWLRDLLFPQMSEPLIILLEFKHLPQDNPSNYFLALAARLLPTKGLSYARWVANQQDIQNVAQNLAGDFAQPHSNRASFALLRYLILEDRLNVQAVLIGMHSRSAEPNVANTVQEFVAAMQTKNIPVFYDLPVGHVQPNYPVPFGKSKLKLRGSVLSITSNESAEERYTRMLINPTIYVLLFLFGVLAGISALGAGAILLLSLIVRATSLKFITALLFVASAFLPTIAIPGKISSVPLRQLMVLLAMIVSPCIFLHYFEPMTNGTALISLILLATSSLVALFSFENSGLKHPRPQKRRLQWIISTWCCLIIPAMALSFVEEVLIIVLKVLPSSAFLSTATEYLCIGIIGLIFILNCINLKSPVHQLFGKIASLLHFAQRMIRGPA